MSVKYENQFAGGPVGGPILFTDGTAAAPSMTFASDTDTGIYRVAANTIGVSTNGALRFQIDGSGYGKFFDHLRFASGSALTANQFSIGVDNSGAFIMNTANGGVLHLSAGGVDTISSGVFSPCTITQSSASGGTINSLITATGAAHTGLTTVASQIVLNVGQSIQYNVASPVSALQTAVFTPPTYSFAASTTVNLCAGWNFAGIPQQSTNAKFSAVAAVLTGSIGYTGLCDVGGSIMGNAIFMPGIGSGSGNVGQLAGVAILSAGNVSLGNQAITITSLNSLSLSGITYVASAAVTVTSPVTLTLAAPNNGAGVTFTNPARALNCTGRADFTAAIVSTSTINTTGLFTASGGMALTGNFTQVSGNIGYFGVSAVGQQNAGTALTNNVTGGALNFIISNFTDLVVYANDAPTIKNDIYQLTAKMVNIEALIRAYGLGA